MLSCTASHVLSAPTLAEQRAVLCEVKREHEALQEERVRGDQVPGAVAAVVADRRGTRITSDLIVGATHKK